MDSKKNFSTHYEDAIILRKVYKDSFNARDENNFEKFI